MKYRMRFSGTNRIFIIGSGQTSKTTLITFCVNVYKDNKQIYNDEYLTSWRCLRYYSRIELLKQKIWNCK